MAALAVLGEVTPLPEVLSAVLTHVRACTRVRVHVLPQVASRGVRLAAPAAQPTHVMSARQMCVQLRSKCEQQQPPLLLLLLLLLHGARGAQARTRGRHAGVRRGACPCGAGGGVSTA